MSGVGQQQDERADGAADDRAEGGQQIRQTHEHGYQHPIGHPEHGHENEIRHAYDESVEQIAGNVADQDPVALAADKAETAVLLLFHMLPHGFFDDFEQLFLGHQEIDRQNNTDHAVEEALADVYRGVEHAAYVLPQSERQPFQHALSVLDQCGYVQPKLAEGEHRLVEGVLQRADISAEVVHQNAYALKYLRDQSQSQRHQKGEQQQHRHHERDETPALVRGDLFEYLLLEKNHQSVDQIGENDPAEDRRYKAEHHRYPVPDVSDVGQQQINHYRRAGGDSVRYPVFTQHILIEFHRAQPHKTGIPYYIKCASE